MHHDHPQCAPWGHYDDVDHQENPKGAVQQHHHAGGSPGAPAGTELPVAFRLGDVYALEFADETFDGCRADRLFHHLSEPDRALRELMRVTRPGGRIVLFDPDFDASVIASADKIVARQVIHAICDRVRAGAESRNHLARMRRAGLADIVVIPKTFLFLDYALGEQMLGIESAVQGLVDQGDCRPSGSRPVAWRPQAEGQRLSLSQHDPGLHRRRAQDCRPLATTASLCRPGVTLSTSQGEESTYERIRLTQP